MAPLAYSYGDRRHGAISYHVVIMGRFYSLYERNTKVDSSTTLVPMPPGVHKV